MPNEIDDKDVLSRFAINDDHVKQYKKQERFYLHWRGFTPRSRDPDPKSLSVCLSTHVDSSRLTEIGRIVAATQYGSLKGWADVCALNVRSCDLDAVDDEGDYDEHASIIGWAPDGDDVPSRAEQAQTLQKLASDLILPVEE